MLVVCYSTCGQVKRPSDQWCLKLLSSLNSRRHRLNITASLPGCATPHLRSMPATGQPLLADAQPD